MCDIKFCGLHLRQAYTCMSVLVLLTIWGQIQIVCGAGYFPDLIDLAALKPISATSTCGTTSSKYCSSGTSSDSVKTCVEKSCKLDCCPTCGRTTPSKYDLSVGTRNGIEAGPPRIGSNVSSLRFQRSRASRISPNDLPFIDYISKGFAISVWIKQVTGNKGIIVSKFDSRTSNTVYSLVIENYKIWLYYNHTTFVQVEPLDSNRQKLRLQQDEWHFITVTVINTDLVYFIDGEFVKGTELTAAIKDSPGVVYIGRKDRFTDANQYEGLMQDVYMYSQALTNREVIEAYTGKLPTVYIESHCRCPPGFPKIKSDKPGRCITNREINDVEVSRVDSTGHPVEFVLDNVLATYWLSQLTDTVSLDINLEYGVLQVFHVLMTFYGPFPKGVKIEKSVDNGQTYQEWQYFAEDCPSSFMMTNNGRLTEPDSVNCIQYPRPLTYDQGQLVFRTEQPPPRAHQYFSDPSAVDVTSCTARRSFYSF